MTKEEALKSAKELNEWIKSQNQSGDDYTWAEVLRLANDDFCPKCHGRLHGSCCWACYESRNLD